MWLVNIVLGLLADEVIMGIVKKLITRVVNSTVDKVGIDNEDTKYLIKEIARSSLNDFKSVKQ